MPNSTVRAAATGLPGSDPIFAAIEKHRSSRLAMNEACELTDAVLAKQAKRKVTAEDRQRYNAASAAEAAALDALAATVPATLGGLLAGLRYLRAYADESDSLARFVATVTGADLPFAEMPVATNLQTPLSALRDDVLNLTRAEEVLDIKKTAEKDRHQRMMLDQRFSRVIVARDALIDAATWLPATTPGDALFHLSVVADLANRMLSVDGLSQNALDELGDLQESISRVLYSVARIVEGLAPGVTLQHDGVGFHFLSARCDHLRDLVEDVEEGAAHPRELEDA